MTTGLVLVGAVSFATAGQLLLKTGMNEVGRIGGRDVAALLTLVANVVTTWQVVVGLFMFGMSAVLWLVTLSRLPLSTAYPFVSLSYVLILTFSWFLLDERPGLLVWVGALLIMGGITLVGLGQR